MNRTIATVLTVVVAACGGDDQASQDDAAPIDATVVDAAPDGPVVDAGPDAIGPDAGPLANPGFPIPTAITRANVRTGGVWNEVGDADWTCLGAASTDLPATGPIALSGRIDDFQVGDGVGGAQVTAFPMLTPTTALGTTTSSNQAATRGNFAMTVAALPAGIRRYGFTIVATGYLKTYVVARYLIPGAAQAIALSAMAESTANALPAFIGVTRDPGEAITLGTMVDCQGRAVSNAVATVSTTPTSVTHAAGVDTYYFSAGSVSLPVRHSQAPVMNKDGQFMVLGVPPLASAYAHVWGFRTAGELASGTLTLLAEAAVVAEANAVSTVALQPRRAP